MYLKNMINSFKKVDIDGNGIINEDEFLKLLNILKVNKGSSEEKLSNILTKADPFNQKKITFSQCIKYFSSQPFEEEDDNLLIRDKRNLLDKICLDNADSGISL